MYAIRYNVFMKIKLTTENKLGLSKEILAVLAKDDIDVKKVEVETGLMFVETEAIEKQQEAKMASLLMQINGVNWVENVANMPAYENNLFLTSLLDAVPDPVVLHNCCLCSTLGSSKVPSRRVGVLTRNVLRLALHELFNSSSA